MTNKGGAAMMSNQEIDAAVRRLVKAMIESGTAPIKPKDQAAIDDLTNLGISLLQAIHEIARPPLRVS